MRPSPVIAMLCRHCGLAAPAGSMFCCSGCETVHDLLVSRGLTHFYDLNLPLSGSPRPVTRDMNTPVSEIQSAEKTKFYLEGIHCLGCLWLLEKLPELDPRITSSALDISHQILEVHIQPGSIKWSEVIRLLGNLGYTAKPIAEHSENEAQVKDQRKQLARLALAGFCAGNVMLLSVSIYAGTDAWWSRNFGWLSLGLALPSLSYAAWPIYRSAFMPLRQGQLSVDLAIGLALLAGITTSVWSLLQGSAQGIYFDSLTMLIFLLLASRTLLNRFRASLAKESPFLSLVKGERYERLGQENQFAAPEEVQAGDRLLVKSGQTIPADATLLSEYGHLDLSLLTGESAPVKCRMGDPLDSGSRIVGSSVEIQALRPAQASRLAKILEQIRVFQLRRSPSIEFADRMARYFVLVVLSLALLTILLIPSEAGLQRALALVIVTCPCVLAFAIPLTLTRALQLAARRGILFRNAEKLEELAAAKKIFLDKTGTVTTGQFEVLRWEQKNGDPLETRAAARALELASTHPVAKAIVHFTKEVQASSLSDFREIPGAGVCGRLRGEIWSVLRLEEASKCGENQLGVFREQELQATIALGDSLREGSVAAVNALRSLGLDLTLLSGDTEDNVAATARVLGIPWKSRMRPEEKAAFVSGMGGVMVGDGANDAAAFQAAAVGVAVAGAMELSLKNSDLVLTRPGLHSLVEAFKISRQTMAIIRSNFSVTLAYNLCAGILALTGHMSPLLAAILMPLSAMSVYLLTQWRSSRGLV